MTGEYPAPDQLLTYEEAAQRLRAKSKKTVARLVARGQLERRQLGDKSNSPVRIVEASLDAFIAGPDVAVVAPVVAATETTGAPDA